MQALDKRTAVIEGLAEFGVVLQPEFRFDAPHSLDMLYAAVYSALAARDRADGTVRQEDKTDKKTKKKNSEDDPEKQTLIVSYSEDASHGHISGARAEQLLNDSRVKSFYRR